jgi:hypothetical protein
MTQSTKIIPVFRVAMVIFFRAQLVAFSVGCVFLGLDIAFHEHGNVALQMFGSGLLGCGVGFVFAQKVLLRVIRQRRNWTAPK